MSRSVELDFRGSVPDVKLSDEGLERHAMLYLSGHGPVKLSDFEKSSLKEYLSAGGVLWADACCGRDEFDESVREMVFDLFGRKLARLPPDHPVYSVGYRIGKVRVCRAHRSTEMTEEAPELEGLEIDGRLAVVYSRHSLGHTWRSYRFGLPCMMDDEDGRRLSSNILLYFMTR